MKAVADPPMVFFLPYRLAPDPAEVDAEVARIGAADEAFDHQMTHDEEALEYIEACQLRCREGRTLDPLVGELFGL